MQCQTSRQSWRLFHKALVLVPSYFYCIRRTSLDLGKLNWGNLPTILLSGTMVEPPKKLIIDYRKVWIKHPSFAKGGKLN